jgi:hypothetical protein
MITRPDINWGHLPRLASKAAVEEIRRDASEELQEFRSSGVQESGVRSQESGVRSQELEDGLQ